MIDAPEGLLSYLQSEESRALDASLNEDRKVALDFYHGRPFGDEEDGRSQLVTRDVAEVVDAMAVSIMRTVISDKVVEFEARKAGDIEQPQPVEGQDNAQAQRQAVAAAGRAAQDRAQDATELVAWQFMRAQSGYRIVHDCLKAGLLEKTGVFKTWAEPTFEIVEGDALASEIDADETIIAAEPIPDAFALVGDMAEQVYAVRRRVEGKVKYRDEAVPNEEFRFSPEARELDEAAYIQHRARRTLAALMRDHGIAQVDAEALWDDSNAAQSLSDARDTDRGRKDSEQSYGSGISRQVWLSEEYVRWDVRGDGTESLICVHRVGTKILSIEEVEEQPFVIWCPFPMHHRIVGQSLADKTMDIQRVRSVLLRQAMDALYFANAPRPYIDMQQCDENTIDDVLSIVPGSPIRGKGPNSVQFMTQPFAAPHAFTALEFMTGERESRTGVTRHNRGLNADTLNNTATGYKLQMEAGDEWEEYVARNFAEALSELFEKKLRLMRRYGAVESLRVGGEFKQVDASSFDDEMDMAIRVGLGTGRKDARIQARMFLLEQQKEGLMTGSPLVDNDKIYNSMAGFIADSGLGDANLYINDPAQMGEQPERPSPEEQALQAEQAREDAKLELERAKAVAKSQTERQVAQARMELMREETAAKLELESERAEAEARMNLEKMAFEQGMAERTALFNERMAMANAERAASAAESDPISKNRPGGALDA